MTDTVLYLVTRASAPLPTTPVHLAAEASIVLLHGVDLPHTGAHVYQLLEDTDSTNSSSSPQVITHKDLVRMVFEASRVVVL